MTSIPDADLLKGLKLNTPEFKELAKEYKLRNSDNGLLETKILGDTSSYISNQRYLDDINLITFNTLIPAVEIVLKQTKDADSPSNKVAISKEMDRITDYFENMFWDFVVIGYLCGLISYEQPDSPLSNARKGAVKRRGAASIGKEMNKEFKDLLKARMFNFVTQNTVEICMQLSLMNIDNIVLKDVPMMFPLIAPDANGNKEYTIGRDCFVLLGLGISLAVNDLMGR